MTDDASRLIPSSLSKEIGKVQLVYHQSPASRRTFKFRPFLKTALREISDGITSRVRFNAVVKTGVPGVIPRAK
jgi:hypothetical protein